MATINKNDAIVPKEDTEAKLNPSETAEEPKAAMIPGEDTTDAKIDADLEREAFAKKSDTEVSIPNTHKPTKVAVASEAKLNPSETAEECKVAMMPPEDTAEVRLDAYLESAEAFAKAGMEVSIPNTNKPTNIPVDSSTRSFHSQQLEDILGGIETLPNHARGSQRKRSESIPGAHPIAGPGLSAAAPAPLVLLEEAPSETPQTRSTEHTSSNSLDAFLYLSSEFDLAPNCEEAQVDRFPQAEAIPMPCRKTSSTSTTRRAKPLLMLVVIIIVLVLGLVLIMVFLLQNNRQETTDPDLNDLLMSTSSRPGRPVIYPPFQDGLNPLTVKAIEKGPETPESMANAWMWKDPNLQNYYLERQLARFSLAALYYSTQGDNWYRNDFWLDHNTSECLWFSQSNQPLCDDDDKLLRLELQSNNLNGTLPQHNLWDLKAKYLDVSNNSIQGDVSPFPADMNWWEHCDFSNNLLSGPITGDGGLSLNNLKFVDFANNCMGGNNGLVYKLTPKLQVLNLTNNCIKREISAFLNYTQLQHLAVANNDLYGTMPKTLAQVTTLKTMSYAGNARLTGSLPTEMNQLTNLVSLDLVGTQFTGAFPETFCEKQRQGLLVIRANCSLMECCE